MRIAKRWQIRPGSEWNPKPCQPVPRPVVERWLDRVRAQYMADREAGGFTLLTVRLGEALVDHLAASGRLDPCYATLAREVRCSKGAIRIHLRKLRDADYLTWQRRVVVEDGRPRQASNLYQIEFPTCPVVGRPRDVKLCPRTKPEDKTRALNKVHDLAAGIERMDSGRALAGLAAIAGGAEAQARMAAYLADQRNARRAAKPWGLGVRPD